MPWARRAAPPPTGRGGAGRDGAGSPIRRSPHQVQLEPAMTTLRGDARFRRFNKNPPQEQPMPDGRGARRARAAGCIQGSAAGRSRVARGPCGRAGPGQAGPVITDTGGDFAALHQQVTPAGLGRPRRWRRQPASATPCGLQPSARAQGGRLPVCGPVRYALPRSAPPKRKRTRA